MSEIEKEDSWGPLDAALAAQRQASEAGQCFAAEIYLEKYPELAANSECAVDLVYNEFLLATEQESVAGRSPPQPEEYYARFPALQEELRKQFQLHQGLEGLETLDSNVRIEEAVGAPETRFALEEKLAVGGFAEVYKAWDNQLKRHVALKIARHGAAPESRYYQRFEREAESAARLAHANIVAVFEFGFDEGRPFIVSQLMEGGSLADRLASGPVKPRQAASWMKQICDAVEYAHRLGVIHRDIKPGNILFDQVDVPYLTDFGLASLRDCDQHLTEHGDLLGTPAYMSPEQAQGNQNVGTASDIYSLGVVLYELLCAKLPFEGQTHQVLQQTIYQEPQPPTEVGRTVPADLSTICLKAMAKEPSARYESAQAMGSDLQRFLDYEPIKAKPIRMWGRIMRFCRRQPALTVTITLAMLAVLLTAAFGFRGIAIQRDLYRAERDRANNELYHALLTQAENDLRVKPMGWYEKALRALERAADIHANQPPERAHRELMIEALASASPRFVVSGEIQLSAPPTQLAIEPNGKWLAVALEDGTLGLVSQNLDGPFRTVEAEVDASWGRLEFSHDGEALFGLAGRQLWRIDLESELGSTANLQPQLLMGGVDHFALGPQGNIAIVRGQRIEVSEIEVAGETRGKPAIIQLPQATVLDIGFSDSQKLIASLDNALLVQWSVETGTELNRYRHPTPVYHLGLSEGRTYFSDLASNRVQGFRDFGALSETPLLHTRINHVGFTRGRNLIAATRRGELLLVDYNRSPPEVVAQAGGYGANRVVATSLLSSAAYCGYADGRIRKWSIVGSSWVEEVAGLWQPLDVDDQGDFYSSFVKISPSTGKKEGFGEGRIQFGMAGPESIRLFARGAEFVTLHLDGSWKTTDTQQGTIEKMAMSPNQRWIVTQKAQELHLWRCPSLELVQRFELPSSDCLALALTGDDLLLALPDGVYRNEEFLDTKKSAKLDLAPLELTSLVEFRQSKASIAADQSLVVMTGPQDSIGIWDAASLKPIGEIASTGTLQQAITLQQPSQKICALDVENTFRIWNRDGELLDQFAVAGNAKSFAMDPLQEFLVVACSDRMLLYDMETHREIGSFPDAQHSATCWFENDGGHLWIDNQCYHRSELVQSRISNRNLQNYELAFPASPMIDQFTCSVSGDGKWYVSAGHDRHIYVRDQKTLETIRILGANAGFEEIWCSEFSSDSRWLAIGAQKQGRGDISLWSTDTWTLAERFSFSNKLVADVCFHPQRPLLAASSYDGSIALFGMEGQLIQELRPAGPAALDLEFNESGTLLAATRSTAGVALWSIGSEEHSTASEFMVWQDPNEHLWGLSFSPGEDMLATVAESGKIRLYAVPSGENLVTLKSSSNALRKVAFSPDGEYMAISRYMTGGQVWDLGNLRRKLQSLGLDW